MGYAQFETRKQSPTGWATAGTASSVYSNIASSGKWRLARAWFTADVTAALDATNTSTLAIKNGSTTLGTLSNAAAAFAAGVAREFTLTGGASLEFSAGEEIEFAKSIAASGTAITGEFELAWEKVQADTTYV